MDAGLDSLLFWGSLAVALVIAGIAAFPVNRWLITRGRGHAVVHGAPLNERREAALLPDPGTDGAAETSRAVLDGRPFIL